MAGDEGSSWRLRTGPYLGEISALCFIPLPPSTSSFPLLLAGTGSELLVYEVESGNLIDAVQVFEGVRVHGISLRSPEGKEVGLSSEADSLIAVFGERRVKLFHLRSDVALSDGGGGSLSVRLELVQRLPRFDHWLLDACFLKEDELLAMGLSDNSVALWDLTRSHVVTRVESSERCLLYSMRMWGDSLKELRIASGTIYNEIIVWKLIPNSEHPSSTLSMEQFYPIKSNHAEDIQNNGKNYISFHLNRLTGHEGSIFRMAWSSDGTRLMSVSDDRSARIWVISCQNQGFDNFREAPSDCFSSDVTLFGHNARIWDCYISQPVLITAGEDCTCRAWGMNGDQLIVFKEHVGRGIWRCLYDPDSSLLVSAGFDSAIKVHQLYSSSKEARERDEILDDLEVHREIFEICVPKLTKQLGLMDSKSEYVRCIQFTRENILYVATNNGYLYHAELSSPECVKWTELIQVREAQIICMDILSLNFSESSLHEDIVAIGDGKGKVTIVGLRYDNHTPKVVLSLTWSAEMERQLLGVHWCRSLGRSYLFTSDPRGMLKLWKIIKDDFQPDALATTICPSALLLAVFKSTFRHRIMSVDASSKEEVLICGDKRGNIALFPLLEELVAENCEGTREIFPLDHFRGAHGISSVTSIYIAKPYLNHVDVQTTGADGCICYFKYNRNLKKIEFTGMKQVKELSLIQSVFSCSNSQDIAFHNHAIGFTSIDFIMWDLTNEIETTRIPCGGWRRPYSFHFGMVPEHQNCFAYLKDHIIHVHRLWVVAKEKLFPKVLHMQFHGREIHSLCFISLHLVPELDKGCHSWIATASEDGSVRLARYSPCEIGRWSQSILLGEHVGGSAVRSICFISKVYTFKCPMSSPSSGAYYSAADCNEDLLLLISVGSKQVLTSWVLKCSIAENDTSQLSVSFQWLSSHIPQKFANCQKRVGKLMDIPEEGTCSTFKSHQISTLNSTECREGKHDYSFVDQIDNDWRYLAVTAFLVKHVDSRITICFIVVACSDATLMLKALLLPYRLWFDVALLVPTISPVLSLQHIVVSGNLCSSDTARIGNAYFLTSGSTDGSITFWDITEAVESFMQQVLNVQPQIFIDCQRRPKTGRGSQGGRRWRSLMNLSSEKRSRNPNGTNDITDLNSCESELESSSAAESDRMNHPSSAQLKSHIPREPSNILSSDLREIRPLRVFGSVHQSGVNCLHVSVIKEAQHSKSEVAYCVISGGDDQSLHLLGFSLQVEANDRGSCFSDNHSVDARQKLSVLFQNRVSSAHSSAVKCISSTPFWLIGNKEASALHLEQSSEMWLNVGIVNAGVWTDGIWAFSTGLDQRIRCWQVNSMSGLTEHANVLVTVPEPEALDATPISDSEGNRYQIAVAGRGMQMVEFTSAAAQ